MIEETNLSREIETAFATATKENLRKITKILERLISEVEDPTERRHYMSALEVLPDMVKSASARPGTDTGDD